MAIEVVPVILLPTMDANRFERCTFALDERRATMTIYMTDLEPFVVRFNHLLWHRFTPSDECPSTLSEGCLMAVAEVKNSPALRHHITREKIPEKEAQELHHYKIFFGKGGCHEAFASSASLRWRDEPRGWDRVRALFTPVTKAGGRE
jgi:hypothetical protein